MAAGLVYKTLATADSPAQTFQAAFYDDGAGHLFPASVLWDLGSGSLVTFTGPSSVIPGPRESELCLHDVATTLGATGNIGDQLDFIQIIPLTTSPGAVTVKDGTGGTPITVFTGGPSSVASLVPFCIPWFKTSAAAGGWIVTCGANVNALGVGDFT
jgi:hypothetical protein